MKRHTTTQYLSDLSVKTRLAALLVRLTVLELARQGATEVSRRVHHRRVARRTLRLHRALKVGAGAGALGLMATGIAVARTHRHEPHADVGASET